MKRSDNMAERLTALCLAAALMGSTTAEGARTGLAVGPSQLWQDMRAGQRRTIAIMGSSMSQTRDSYWPSELGKQLGSGYGCSAAIREDGTKAAFTSAMGRNAVPTVIALQPDAVIMEYAYTDCSPTAGIPIDKHRKFMGEIIDSLRAGIAGVEIFVYETGQLGRSEIKSRPALADYYAASRQVAEAKGTYFIPTYGRFMAIYDSLAARGQLSKWTQWVYDGHHPTLQAALEIIVPRMIAVISGKPGSQHDPSVALSVQSLEGRAFYVGADIELSWYRDPDRVEGVRLQFSADGGKSFESITEGSLSATEYVWTIPSTLGGTSTITDQAVVRVRDVGGSHQSETGTFRILPSTTTPAISVESLAGKRYRVGETVPVRWNFDPNRVQSVQVLVSFDDGKIRQPLTDKSLTTEHFDWVIPAEVDGAPAVGEHIRIIVADYNDKYEASSGTFAIEQAAANSASPVRHRGQITSTGANRPSEMIFDLRGARCDRSRAFPGARIWVRPGSYGLMVPSAATSR